MILILKLFFVEPRTHDTIKPESVCLKLDPNNDCLPIDNNIINITTPKVIDTDALADSLAEKLHHNSRYT